LNQLQNAIEISTTRKDASSSPAVNDMPTFKWSSDDANNPIPRFLPENYEVPRTIHPLSIWQQWHHGVSFNEGIAVGPLKNILPSGGPTKHYRQFILLRKFCKELDRTSGVKGNESIAELGVIFNKNAST
jgi:hypothetical protein